jgi:hypothetical protein
MPKKVGFLDVKRRFSHVLTGGQSAVSRVLLGAGSREEHHRASLFRFDQTCQSRLSYATVARHDRRRHHQMAVGQHGRTSIPPY